MKEKCSELELTQRIRFCGHVDGEEKRIAFTSCDIFCLPTHSENFGIVIAEALAHGTPVLTTENAPWESINQIGCGLSIESGVNPIIEAILMLDKSELKEMGCKGRTWMETDYSEKIMGERFNLLYRSLAEQK